MVVPDVVTSLSHERVIVSEFVDGRGFEELKSSRRRSATASAR